MQIKSKNHETFRLSRKSRTNFCRILLESFFFRRRVLSRFIFTPIWYVLTYGWTAGYLSDLCMYVIRLAERWASEQKKGSVRGTVKFPIFPKGLFMPVSFAYSCVEHYSRAFRYFLGVCLCLLKMTWVPLSTFIISSCKGSFGSNLC